MLSQASSPTAFGDWLRGRRKSLGLSREAASKKAGLHANTWGYWERPGSGVERIPVDTVRALARALDITMAEVLEAAGYTGEEVTDE